MNNTFEDDFNFVFAKTGKARAPRASRPGTSTAAGGGKRTLAPDAQRRALLSATKRKPQVMVKITSFGKSKKNVADHLDYISRKGELEVFDNTGDELSSLAERSEREPRDALDDFADRLSDPPGEDDHAVKRRPRDRVTMNLMLSMPEGTDTGAFELAVRDFLQDTFTQNDHVFAFHDDRNHYHAHIAVSLQGADGKWLNPRKADLQDWRQNFAEALEHRGIAAEATPAYSRARGKDNVRKGVIEAERRGKRTRPQRARGPRYDAATEAAAIEQRAGSWSRIGDHYARAGDSEVSDAIREYVADRFDYHPPKPEALEQGGPAAESKALERPAPAPKALEQPERPAAAPAPTQPEALEPTKTTERPAADPGPTQTQPERPAAGPRKRERSSEDRER